MTRQSDVGILAITLDGWSERYTSRHQVLLRLDRYFQVSWVQPPHEWRDTWRAWRERRVATTPPPPIVRPAELWLPRFYSPSWLARATMRARIARARDALASRGCRRFVTYIWNPAMAAELHAVPYDLSLYHIIDEYSYAESERPIDEVESKLIAAVDQVIIHSPALMEKKGRINPHTVWIPNGVDFRAFSTPVPEPADLAAIPRPRIGYCGAIKKQIDWALLDRLSTRHPEWSWVFIGQRRHEDEIAARLNAMDAKANVHFLGEKTSHDLARYPQHFDVCTMPYVDNAYTRYIYPLKLHEYLAAGRPTVATPIKTLEGFTHVVSLAATEDEWSAALSRALEQEARSPEAVHARQAVASQYDWDALVERIANVIDSGLTRSARRATG
jgi:glycosyltransferase involved in cell wall biosynthesis